VWKLPLEGLPTGIKKTSQEAPLSFALKQNSPNPFNPKTTISYSVPVNGIVSLKVYDCQGKEVASVIQEKKSPGTYSAPFDGTALASGLYWYSLKANGLTKIKRMLLLK
jgi:hypothetical protein